MDAKSRTALFTDIERAHRDLNGGRRVEAIVTCEEIAKRNDLDAALHFAIGRLFIELEGDFQAVKHLQQAVAADPDNAEYLGFLGIALQAERRAEEAAEAFEAALALDENLPAVLNGLGVIHSKRGDHDKAIELLKKAERLKPSDGAVQTNLAMAMIAHNTNNDEALKHAEKAVRFLPDNVNAQYVYGTVLSQSGRVEDAIRHYEKAIRQNRLSGGAYNQLSRIKKFTADDKPFIDKAEKVLKRGMPALDRLSLHFALGKMHDDCEEWDAAFEHYRQANLLKKKNFDGRPFSKLLGQAKSMFNAKTLEKYQRMGNPSDMPIFVVGMPRSGTTLMERMITSSDGIAGAGELFEMPHIASQIAPKDKYRQFSALVRAELTEEGIARYSEQYLRVLRQADPNATRIVDKLPSNYLHVWLISILFPKATIVFARRHPLDIALSCYFQNFSGLPWANDFQTIAEEFRLHREAMDHWKKVLPEGSIIDVHYEQLVDEPEVYGKRMLEGCGLEWSGDGHDQYKKEKVVRTASLWQVRQPVYKSSRMRWKNYAPYLGDVANQLAEYLQDDREELRNHGIELSAPSGMSRLKKLFG